MRHYPQALAPTEILNAREANRLDTSHRRTNTSSVIAPNSSVTYVML